MQTYIFTVAITGPDVQDYAESLRDKLIENDNPEEIDVMVTDSVRVTE